MQYGTPRKVQAITAQARRLYLHYAHKSIEWAPLGDKKIVARREMAREAATDFGRLVVMLEDFHADLTCGEDGKQGVDTLGRPVVSS